MKKILALISVGLLAGSYYAWSQVVGSSNSRPLVKEVDGTPTVRPATLVFPNNSIEYENGIATVTFLGIGGPLPEGATNYIQNRDTLQSGSSFYVDNASATTTRTFQMFASSITAQKRLYVQHGAGDNEAPSIALSSAPGTGIYFPKYNELGFTFQGSSFFERMRMTPDTLFIRTGGMGDAVIRSGTRLQINTNNAISAMAAFSHSETADHAGSLRLGKSRGTSSSPTANNTGDTLGSFASDGYDGTSWRTAAGIIFAVDGTVQATRMPTSIEFQTGIGEGSFVKTRLKIGSNANVVVGSTNTDTLFSVFGGSVTIKGVNAGLHIGTDTFTVQPGEQGGNIGAGTGSPTSKFDVLNGSITVRGTNAGLRLASGGIQFPDGTVQVSSPTSTDLTEVEQRLDNLDSSTATLTARLDNLDTSTMTLTLHASNTNYLDLSGSTQTKTGGVNVLSSVGIGTIVPAAKLDITNGNGSGSYGLIMGSNLNSDNRTDGVAKYIRVGVPHYDNSKNPAGVMLASSEQFANNIIIGGGSSFMNAATGIRFYTATGPVSATGLERMEVDNNGNVGINTTTPQSRLHVVGHLTTSSATFTTVGSEASNVGLRVSSSVYLSTSGGSVGIGTDIPVGQFQVSGGSLTVLYNGNVGIGTTDPVSRLDVEASGITKVTVAGYSTTGGRGDLEIRSASGTVGSPLPTPSGIYMGVVGVKGYDGTGWGGSGGNFNALVGFLSEETYTDTENGTRINFETTATGSDARSEKMRITGDGNVGIGTNAPSSKLHVFGHVLASSATFSTTGSGSGNVGLSVSSSVYMATSGGMIGIGTNLPIAQLHVFKDGFAEPIASFDGGSGDKSIRINGQGGEAYIELQNDDTTTTDAWKIGLNDADRLDIARGSAGSMNSALTAMSVLATGNFGIGTTGPQSKFQTFSAAGTNGPQLLVTTGTTNIFEVNGSSIVTRVPWYNLGGSDGQWSVSGSNLYYNAGNIGIGTTAGTYPLNVVGGINIDRPASSPYVYFTRDAVGIGQLRGNEDRMAITNAAGNVEYLSASTTTANVGIGTTKPSSKFDVFNGSITVRGTNAGLAVGGNLLTVHPGGNVGIGTDDPAHTLDVAGTGSFSGNVGIGTAEPLQMLHVNGSRMRISDLAIVDPSSWDILPQTGNNKKIFRIYDADQSLDRLSISTLGYVGIGNVTPSHTIDLFTANGTTRAIIMGDEDSTASNYIGVADRADIAAFAANSGFSGVQFGPPSGTDEGYLAFHTHDFGIASGERMRIDKSGGVGIGTTSPTSKLDISGGSMTIRNPYGMTIGTSMVVQTGTSRVGIGTLSPTSKLDIFGGSVTIRNPYGLAIGTMMVVQTGTGKVGVGISTPSSRLELYGGSMTIRGMEGGGISIHGNSAGINMAQADGSGNGSISTNGLTQSKAGTGGADISADGTELGQIGFQAMHSGSYDNKATIIASAHVSGSSIGGKLAFRMRPLSGGSADALTITSTGYIGIGTTSPAGKLDVNGGIQGHYAVYRDTKAAATSGGTLTAGIWTARALTETTAENGDSITRPHTSSSTITLLAGTYSIRSNASTHRTARNQTRLRNITTGAVIMSGNGHYANPTDGSSNTLLNGVFTTTGTFNVQLEHRCDTTAATHGQGLAVNLGEKEVHAVVEITRIK